MLPSGGNVVIRAGDSELSVVLHLPAISVVRHVEVGRIPAQDSNEVVKRARHTESKKTVFTSSVGVVSHL